MQPRITSCVVVLVLVMTLGVATCWAVGVGQEQVTNTIDQPLCDANPSAEGCSTEVAVPMTPDDVVLEDLLPLPPPPQSRKDYIDAIAALYAARNITAAVDLLQRSANGGGEARAHWMLAVLYAHGIGVEQSDADAVLHHTFAALGGTPESHAALAHRFQHGLGVPQSCEKALFHAQAVADSVAASYHEDIVPQASSVKYTGRGGGRSSSRGRGLGFISTFLGAQVPDRSPDPSTGRNMGNAWQLHTFRLDSGDIKSAMFLAYASMFGNHGIKQDGHKALHYLQMAMDKNVPAAFGAAGQIYWQGMQRADPPIPADRARAFKLFERGAELKDPVSLNGLGVMYAHGVTGVVERRLEEAAALFSKGSEQGNAESAYNLGVMQLLGKGGVAQDIRGAIAAFLRANVGGNPLAAWQLGNLYRRGVADVIPASCPIALEHYNVIIQRGSWSRLLGTAQDSFDRRDYFTSFVDFALAAEVGSPEALWNMAHLLEEELVEVGDAEDAAAGPGVVVLHRTKLSAGPSDVESVTASPSATYEPMDPAEAGESAATTLLSRAADVNNDCDAHLKVGDRYYYSDSQSPHSQVKAKERYTIAAACGNAQAKFNLGVMHQWYGAEHGAEDLHLAKRYYDEAAAADPNAIYAVRLALMSLNWQWWLQHFGNAQSHGGVWSPEALSISIVRGLTPWGPGGWTLPTVFGLAWDDAILLVLTSALPFLLLLRNHLVHR